LPKEPTKRNKFFARQYIIRWFLLNWKVLLEKGEDGWFTATVPSLSGCISQGKNRADALKNIKEAIELHLESLAEEGVPLSVNKELTTVAVRV